MSIWGWYMRVYTCVGVIAECMGIAELASEARHGSANAYFPTVVRGGPCHVRWWNNHTWQCSCVPSSMQPWTGSTSSPLGPTTAPSQQWEREGEKKGDLGQFQPIAGIWLRCAGWKEARALLTAPGDAGWVVASSPSPSLDSGR